MSPFSSLSSTSGPGKFALRAGVLLLVLYVLAVGAFYGWVRFARKVDGVGLLQVALLYP